MAYRVRSAFAAAQWQRPDTVVIEHAVIDEQDVDWMVPIRRLDLWAVKTPPGVLGKLPNLEWLNIRGGTGGNLNAAAGCERLRYFGVNQVRGLNDVSVLPTLKGVELLSLYGLPQVTQIPSLAGLVKLARAEIGSMKGLAGLTGLLDAPVLDELVLIRTVGLAFDDPARIAAHPSIRFFEWYAEDVPDKTWVPVIERVGKPRATVISRKEWFDLHDSPPT